MLSLEKREMLAFLIGYRVRSLRKQKHMAQSELAKGIIGQSMMSMIENGYQLPLPDVLELIAHRLNDPILMEYTEIVQQDLNLVNIPVIDPETLVHALYSHQGKWNQIHYNTAITLCEHYYTQAEYALAKDVADTILLNMDKPHDRPGVYSTACFYYGSVLLRDTQYEDAIDWLLNSEEYKTSLSPDIRGRLFYNLAYGYQHLNYLGMTVVYANLAVMEFATPETILESARARILLGTAQSRIGQTKNAKYSLQTAYNTLIRWATDNTPDLPLIQINLADIYESEGDYEKAQDMLQDALSSPATVHPTAVAAALRIQSRLYMNAGVRLLAVEYAEKSLTYALESGDGWCISWSHLNLSALHTDISQKLTHAKSALQKAMTTQNYLLSALACESLSFLHQQVEEHDKAMQYLRETVLYYRAFAEQNIMIKASIQFLPLHRIRF